MLKKKGFAVVVAAMLLTLLLNVQGQNTAGTEKTMAYTEFMVHLEQGRVKSVDYSEEALWNLELTDGTKWTTPNPRSEGMKETLLKMGVDVTEKPSVKPLPLLLACGLLTAVFLRKKEDMAQFAKTETHDAVPDKTFRDVVIDEETKCAMMDLTRYLKHPEVYAQMGARPPRGVLLYGPPGTGKTLLAQALAGETGKGFFAVSGSDFVQVYVGVGASRIRHLFKKARKAGGGVIFIDEIDALGKKRDNGNDEREQTLNALLTEMNGFHEGEGIIVLAATNRPETLDRALLREGRFDRRIEMGLPDARGRKRIMEVHMQNKPMAGDVQVEEWARRTAYFTGAQLESLVNEAAIRAIREGEKEIGCRHLEAAFYAQIAGDERSIQMTEREREIIAVHEAGHALVTCALLPECSLSRVTILPTARGAAGYSLSILPDQLLYTRQEWLCRMAAALGGRAAEEMAFGKEHVTNGAANDLEKAQAMAEQMVKWRMGESCEQLMEEAMALSLKTIGEKEGEWQRIWQALMEKDTLTGEEIRAFVA